MASTNILVAKIWSFCDTLRDDGLGYGDYLEQLTYLLFLKMADENKSQYQIPRGCDWQELKSSGQIIETYESILKKLSSSGGMLSKIFAGALNKIHDSVKLKKLINLIDEEDWTSHEIDVKGEIYESLLQKNAENSGAGQYFTPRAVINAMVDCIQPKPKETVADPSCGTGGFFLGVLNHLRKTKLTKPQQEFLKFQTFKGWEIEKATARLCLMNLFLHGIGDLKETPEIEVTDSLKRDDGEILESEKVDIVLANPPFGISSSDIPTIDKKQAEKDGYFLRKDFWVTTSNKQLSFLQHIVNMLKDHGRAAVVLPDNVLFEGGPGETIRKKLLENTNLHTILRLPTGIFYAQGVKSNVLFFQKETISDNPATKEVWIYDYRTNVRHTPKKNPLKHEHLEDFIKCFKATDISKREESWNKMSETGRWRKYSYEEIIERDKTSLDIFWLKDDNLIDLDNLPDPDVLIDDIIENIESALANFKAIRDSVS
ncbi:type I restriction enzyme M protein [Pedobacter psychrotolerans]|uniref:site-specific DNA-methyltransferase (adenine-specific) n=1 Tax=Pedobacter psychrotolerans TaxID=1843235 RepID=A0A4R2HMA1_9SPHI|nr:class I SAM-dependent DNA methyltransferase [Pedobacter psychrotolerans]TCO31357.1 type I restriction enzyme M protein [Pedobacter psychrotolerans]GGE40357.1 SAM-dependent DNA methyltransferase [Pedobacter psychrotolerans]